MEENPYTIYAVKKSKSTGDNRAGAATVHYNDAMDTFSVGNKKGRGYSSLKSLIDGNKDTLKDIVTLETPPSTCPSKTNDYINPKEIIGTKDDCQRNKRERSGDGCCTEDYRK